MIAAGCNHIMAMKSAVKWDISNAKKKKKSVIQLLNHVLLVINNMSDV